MKTEALLSMLESVVAPHLEYIPPMLRQGKRDLVISGLGLLAVLRTGKYDELIDNKDFFLEFLPNCLKIVERRPRKERQDFLFREFLGFSVAQQRELLKVFPLFEAKKRTGEFLCTCYDKLSSILGKEILLSLSFLGKSEYDRFVLEHLQEPVFSVAVRCEILDNMCLGDIKFDAEFTSFIADLLQNEKEDELYAYYLRLLAKGDMNIAQPHFEAALSSPVESVICAGLDGLLRAKKFNLIPGKILQSHASSRFFPLAAKVAEAYSLLSREKPHKDYFNKGMMIISSLLNESSREAKLSAITGGEFFRSDGRMVDWIGSLLFSETESEVFDKIFDFLQKCDGNTLKPLLVKACERNIPDLTVRALQVFEFLHFPELFDFLVELAHKQKHNHPLVAAAAVFAAAASIPEGREDDFVKFLDDDSVDLQRAAILGLGRVSPGIACKALEQRYQNFSGISLTQTEFVLFQKGAPYILDDLLMMLSKDNHSEQKVAVQALTEIFKWLRTIDPEEIEQDVVNNIQVWCREAETRAKASQSFFDDFDLSLLYELRKLSLREDYELMREKAEALCNIHADNFFLQVAVIYSNHCLSGEIVPETCFQVVSRADDFMLVYACLNKWYLRCKHKKEFLLNQLHIVEILHGYYGEILRLVNNIPRSDLEGPVFLNLLKIAQNASLPSDASLHTMFAQIMIKFRDYEKAFRQLLFGFFTNPGRNYMLELASAALKCGYLQKAAEICSLGAEEENLTDSQKEKFNRLNEKIQDILAIRS